MICLAVLFPLKGVCCVGASFLSRTLFLRRFTKAVSFFVCLLASSTSKSEAVGTCLSNIRRLGSSLGKSAAGLTRQSSLEELGSVVRLGSLASFRPAFAPITLSLCNFEFTVLANEISDLKKRKRTVSLNYENTLRHEGETRFVVIGEITGEDNGGTRPR
ncbi:hypothetical protein YC2023_051573 [Brassica napus]